MERRTQEDLTMIARDSYLHISPPAKKYIPSFEDDEGNRFIMPYKDLVMDTRAEADLKGTEVMFRLLLEGIINVAYTEPLEVSGSKMDLPNFSAKLGEREVAVFAGPAFDKQMAIYEAREADRQHYESEVNRVTERGD